jgi:hypothetical protein
MVPTSRWKLLVVFLAIDFLIRRKRVPGQHHEAISRHKAPPCIQIPDLIYDWIVPSLSVAKGIFLNKKQVQFRIKMCSASKRRRREPPSNCPRQKQCAANNTSSSTTPPSDPPAGSSSSPPTLKWAIARGFLKPGCACAHWYFAPPPHRTGLR